MRNWFNRGLFVLTVLTHNNNMEKIIFQIRRKVESYSFFKVENHSLLTGLNKYLRTEEKKCSLMVVIRSMGIVIWRVVSSSSPKQRLFQLT